MTLATALASVPKSNSLGPSRVSQTISLRHVAKAIAERPDLSFQEKKKHRQAIERMARHLGDTPEHVPLHMPTIRARFKTSCIGSGLNWKTLSNIKAAFSTAVHESRLIDVVARGNCRKQITLSPEWQVLIPSLPDKRSKIIVMRWARWASSVGISPQRVTDKISARYLSFLVNCSLGDDPDCVFRESVREWNRIVALLSEHGLQSLTVPASRKSRVNIDWGVLNEEFDRDTNRCLAWFGGQDRFAEDARPKTLKPISVNGLRVKLHSGLTLLEESGCDVTKFRSLADFLTVENVRNIAASQIQKSKGINKRQHFLLIAGLVQIAREWVKVDENSLIQLKRILRHIPRPSRTITPKNRQTLGQFDDPKNLRRFLELPDRLWKEVQKAKRPSIGQMKLAQATLGIAVLTYMPIRAKNLAALQFDVHLHLKSRKGSVSSLILDEEETKNASDMAFDIPPQIVRMLMEFREKIVPAAAGFRPSHLFCTRKETVDHINKVKQNIPKVIERYIGLKLNVHAFRHLSGKFILDRDPGAFELVKQILGHKNIATTVNYYTGLDTRRAGRHHQQLLEEALQRVSARERRGHKKAKPKHAASDHYV